MERIGDIDNYSANIANMFNIGVLLLDNSYCSCISGFVDVFQIANAHCRRMPEFSSEPFRWSFMAERVGKPVALKGGIQLVADSSLESASNLDMLYLPGIFYSGGDSLEGWLENQQGLTSRLQKLHNQGIKIAANCTATFLLAEAGLLTNQLATTTWWLEQKFRQRYPDVNLNATLAVTEDNNIYCAGAMTAYQQLALRLVEEYSSAEVAMLCAKTMLINQGQIAQAPYQDLNTPITNEDPLISRAQYWLKNHMRTAVDFSLLAQELEVSQRTLIRRFKLATNTTPLTYLQNLRLEHAKILLVKSPLSVSDIMIQIGYNDPSALNRLFKRRVGMTPSAYRQRFSEQTSSRLNS